jgi:hypothetical protein
MVTPSNRTTLSVPWTAGTPVYFDPQDGPAAASISPVTAGSRGHMPSSRAMIIFCTSLVPSPISRIFASR